MSDLTFSMLAGQMPSGAVVALSTTDEVPADGVYIRVGAVTGDAITSLSQQGVLEFVMKLLLACSDAQSNYNSTAPVGQRLQAFPPPSYGQTQRLPGGETTTRINCSLTAVLNVNSDVALAPLI